MRQQVQSTSRSTRAKARPPGRRARVRESDAPHGRSHETASPLPAPLPASEQDAPRLTRRQLFEEGIRARVLGVLSEHEIDQRTIEVAVDGARVVLYGLVGDRITRQLVEDLAWSVAIVHDCENRLRVR